MLFSDINLLRYFLFHRTSVIFITLLALMILPAHSVLAESEPLLAKANQIQASNESRLLSLMGADKALVFAGAQYTQEQTCPKILRHEFRKLDKSDYQSLCQYSGKLILVVNTASKCAYTPQYKGLEKLWQAYKDQGLVVLGFPANNFAGQEPGDDQQIRNFCEVAYGVSFPMFSKTEVTGHRATDFYRQLAQATGEPPGWNFHKYLIAPDGKVLASFRSHIEPEHPELLNMISRYLPGTQSHQLSRNTYIDGADSYGYGSYGYGSYGAGF